MSAGHFYRPLDAMAALRAKPPRSALQNADEQRRELEDERQRLDTAVAALQAEYVGLVLDSRSKIKPPPSHAGSQPDVVRRPDRVRIAETIYYVALLGILVAVAVAFFVKHFLWIALSAASVAVLVVLTKAFELLPNDARRWLSKICLIGFLWMSIGAVLASLVWNIYSIFRG